MSINNINNINVNENHDNKSTTSIILNKLNSKFNNVSLQKDEFLQKAVKITQYNNVYEYASFNRRMIAVSIDLIIILFFVIPITDTIAKISQHTSQHILSLLLYIFAQLFGFFCILLYTLFFWFYKDATIGKLLTRCIIVDAKTFTKPKKKQYLLRIVGYILSSALFFIPFIIACLTKQKRGLHDYIAGTAVIINNQNDKNNKK